MTITVDTKQGPVEVAKEEWQRFIDALDYGFGYLRARSGLSHDAVMMAAHIASRGNLELSYALYELGKQEVLIPYQDTRDQVRYTRAGDFEPFHEKYKQVREEVVDELEMGSVARYTANPSVKNRVLYDLIAREGDDYEKVRGGIRKKSIRLFDGE